MINKLVFHLKNFKYNKSRQKKSNNEKEIYTDMKNMYKTINKLNPELNQ